MVFFSQKRERVTVPLLKFLDQLLTSGFLDPLLEDGSSTFLLHLLLVSELLNVVLSSLVLYRLEVDAAVAAELAAGWWNWNCWSCCYYYYSKPVTTFDLIRLHLGMIVVTVVVM